MHLRRGSSLALLLFPVALSALLASCSSDDPAAVEPTVPGAIPSEAGATETGTGKADGVGPARHPVGQTLILPKGSAWKLESAPAGNANEAYDDEGRSAFVPHVAGAYVFNDGTRTFRASAVPADSLAFHNVNHYPSRSLDEADAGGLWVVSTVTPELVRVDRDTFEITKRIAVGSWPVAVRAVPSRKAVLVANRGEDSISWVDTESGRVVRSIHVGDEVSNLDVAKDGSIAIALLPNDSEAVVIDLETRKVKGRVKVGVDPTYVVVTPDGKRAFVAGRRTGEAAGGSDLVEIDLAKLAVTRSVEDVGTTLGGMTLSGDQKTLYVTALKNDPRASLANPNGGTFRHFVIAYDLTSSAIAELLAKDVTLSPAPAESAASLATRNLVSLHAPVIVDSSLWILSEANDMAVRLSLDTFAELERVTAPGRPRSLLATADGGLFAYGHQALTLSEVGKPRTLVVAKDPRPADVARGQLFFTGVGQYTPAGPPGSGMAIAGDRWSCNSCHADGSSDKLVWQAGPVPTHRYASRPYVMLEATWPLGWQGYLSSVRNYAYTVTGNIGVTNPTTEDVTGLAAYLASIMPPGAANSLTERDGALSAEATKGAPVFQEHCSTCHSGSLATSRGRVEKSLGDGKLADIPSLIGVYRQGVYFRSGAAKTLDAAVDAMVDFSGATLSADETTSLKRYVAELTSRDFFATSTFPPAKQLISARSEIAASFSYPVLNTPENLAKIKLMNGSVAVAATVSCEGRRVVLTPSADLPADAKLTFVVDAGVEAEDGRATASTSKAGYTVAAAPGLSLSGTYTLSYTPVSFGPPGGPPPAARTATLVATPNGDGSSNIVVTFPGRVVTFTTKVVISGKKLIVPPLPLAVASAFADGYSGFEAELSDTTGDGIADAVGAGTGPGASRGYTMSGPGFEAQGLAWDLVRVSAP